MEKVKEWLKRCLSGNSSAHLLIAASSLILFTPYVMTLAWNENFWIRISAILDRSYFDGCINLNYAPSEIFERYIKFGNFSEMESRGSGNPTGSFQAVWKWCNPGLAEINCLFSLIFDGLVEFVIMQLKF